MEDDIIQRLTGVTFDGESIGDIPLAATKLVSDLLQVSEFITGHIAAMYMKI